MLRKIASQTLLNAMLTAKALVTPVAFGVAALAFDSRGRVLLVRQSYMKGWRLPGGGVGRGEAAADAILRELREEVGLTKASAPEFFGLYSRKAGLVTNVIALYRVAGIELDFKPNWEVRETLFADPASPPLGTVPAVLRRLAELNGAARDPYW